MSSLPIAVPRFARALAIQRALKEAGTPHPCAAELSDYDPLGASRKTILPACNDVKQQIGQQQIGQQFGQQAGRTAASGHPRPESGNNQRRSADTQKDDADGRRSLDRLSGRGQPAGLLVDTEKHDVVGVLVGGE